MAMENIEQDNRSQIAALIERYFPPELQREVLSYTDRFPVLQEIRCRINQPIFLRYTQEAEQQTRTIVAPEHMQYIVSRISQGSAYAWEEEFRRGYLTLPGGFRVGMVGKSVLEGGKIRTLTQISALNLRIAKAVPGVADSLMPLLYCGQSVVNCLLVSPPGGGKTTMLRDIVRQLSNGVDSLGQSGRIVAVVDERSELAGCIQGISQMDLGCRTDVLDGCPKSEGIRMLIRAMAPQVIAVDEIGTEADIQALEEAAESGVAIMATAHGASITSLYRHPILKPLMERQYFALIIVLKWQKGQVVLQVYRKAGDGNYAIDRDAVACAGGKCDGVL